MTIPNLSICLWLCLIATTVIVQVSSYPSRFFPKRHNARGKFAGFQNVCNDCNKTPFAASYVDARSKLHIDTSDYVKNTKKQAMKKGKVKIVPYGKAGLEQPDEEIDTEVHHVVTSIKNCKDGMKMASTTKKPVLLKNKFRGVFKKTALPARGGTLPHKFKYLYNHKIYHTPPRKNTYDFDDEAKPNASRENAINSDEQSGERVIKNGHQPEERNEDYQDDEDFDDDYHNDKYHETNDDNDEAVGPYYASLNHGIRDDDYADSSASPCYEEAFETPVHADDATIDTTPSSLNIGHDRSENDDDDDSSDEKEAEHLPVAEERSSEDENDEDNDVDTDDSEQDDDSASDENEEDEESDESQDEENSREKNEEKHIKYIKTLSNTNLDHDSLEDVEPNTSTAEDTSAEVTTPMMKEHHKSYLDYPPNDNFLPHDFNSDNAVQNAPQPVNKDNIYFQYANIIGKGIHTAGARAGNDKHYVEQHERGHKGLGIFQKKVKWADKNGGFGEHYWDLNHDHIDPKDAGYAAEHQDYYR